MPKQLPITTYGMDILRQKSKILKDIDYKIVELVENMFYTMKNAAGIGLAAPQVNRNIALAIVDVSVIDEYKDVKPLVMINPVITGTHREIIMEEGCLSIPEIRAEVSRPEVISLKYYDLNMKEINIEIDDLQARVVQHEIDHLNGKLFVDFLDKETLKEFKKSLNLIKKGKLETDYPLFIHEGEEQD